MRIQVTSDVDECVARRIEFCKKCEYPLKSGPPQPFVTISREFGCEAFDVATGLIQELSARSESGLPWDAFDKTLIEWVARDSQVFERAVESMPPEHRKCYEGFLREKALNVTSGDELVLRMAKVVKCVARHGRAVIIGRGGYLICADMPAGFHVQLVAPKKWRIEQAALQHNFTCEREAGNYLEMMDKTRRQFFCFHFNREAGYRDDFDLVIDNERCSPPEIVDMVISALKQRGMLRD
jgi:cytidylate kinase